MTGAAQRMEIQVIPSTYDCLNMGDAAMLQAAVSRLKALWPESTVRVPTSDFELLKRLCPASDPLLRGDGKGNGHGNGTNRRFAARLASAVLRRVGGGRAARAASGTAVGKNTDLLVASGAGGINDVFASYSRMVLSTLEDAVRRKVPTALLGHGLGPLEDPELRARAREVLPHVDLIALREKVSGPAILASLGVDPKRVRTTGDDAVASAYESRPASLGSGLGVNLRISGNSSVGDADLAELRPALLAFAAALEAPLLPVPISRKGGVDARAIRALIEGNPGAGDSADGGEALDTPDAVIRQVGRCRVVVTGAYHAAVFALAQGVPAICLYRSEYFEKKFLGLRDLFGSACEPLALAPGWPSEFRRRLDAAWDGADASREGLLEAAARQSRMGHEVYNELRSIVEAHHS